MNDTNLVTIETTCSSAALDLRISDRRPDLLAMLVAMDERERNGLLADAYVVGLRAVMSAQHQAVEARLSDVARTLREDLDHGSDALLKRQEAMLGLVLEGYFDPKKGQVAGRLDNFLRDGGELAHALERYFSPERGLLAQTLAREVGANSPLFKLLSPTDAEGFAQVLERRIQEVLDSQQADFAKALDPLAKDGALARFLVSLRKELEAAGEGRDKQLAAALAALNANDEGSLISRLMRETQAARRQLVNAMNPEVKDSPMAILKDTLTATLERSAEAQQKSMAELTALVARVEERRRSDGRSIHGGLKFQEAVGTFVAGAFHGAPAVVDVTANVKGAITNCKVGDFVVELTEESAFPGAKIVIEAKQEKNFTVPSALKELDVARANREAGVGVLVLARGHAPAGAAPLARHGKSILVLWDETDEASDAYLHAALTLAMALSSRSHGGADRGNIAALSDIEHRIETELARLEKVRDLATKIETHAGSLKEEVRKAGKAFGVLLDKTKATLRALDVELAGADATPAGPVALPAGSLTDARAALAHPAAAE